MKETTKIKCEQKSWKIIWGEMKSRINCLHYKLSVVMMTSWSNDELYEKDDDDEVKTRMMLDVAWWFWLDDT